MDHDETLAPGDYPALLRQAEALLAGETDYLANAANLAALLYAHLPRINWAGFYFFDGHELVLGPFQGKVACTRISLDRGVCGAAARARKSLIVADVHAFAGHIACDAASASELVVPMLRGDALIGVLDIDSPEKNRFGPAEQELAEGLVALYIRASNSVSCAAFSTR